MQCVLFDCELGCLMFDLYGVVSDHVDRSVRVFVDGCPMRKMLLVNVL